MRIEVYVDPREALRKGLDVCGRQVVDVPAEALSAEDREALASVGAESPTSPGVLAISKSKPCPSADVAGIKALAAGIITKRAEEARREAEREAKKAADAKRCAEAKERVTAETLQKEPGELVAIATGMGSAGVGWQVALPSEFVPQRLSTSKRVMPDMTDPAVKALVAEAQALADARNVERREAQERKERESEERKIAAIVNYEAERAAWIEAHGSERLKRCVAEEIECDAIYRDERLAAERPGWGFTQGLPGDYSDPRNPPEAALDLLDEARKAEPEAELFYWTMDQEEHARALGMDEDSYYDDDWRGYVAVATFLNREIAYLPADWPSAEGASAGKEE